MPRLQILAPPSKGETASHRGHICSATFDVVDEWTPQPPGLEARAEELASDQQGRGQNLRRSPGMSESSVSTPPPRHEQHGDGATGEVEPARGGDEKEAGGGADVPGSLEGDLCDNDQTELRQTADVNPEEGATEMPMPRLDRERLGGGEEEENAKGGEEKEEENSEVGVSEFAAELRDGAAEGVEPESELAATSPSPPLPPPPPRRRRRTDSHRHPGRQPQISSRSFLKVTGKVSDCVAVAKPD